MNFLLMEMTHLRYWMPLVIEGNKRGIQSVFYIAPSHKYNCPHKYESVLAQLVIHHNVLFKDIADVKSAKGLLFSNEKTGVNFVAKAKDTKKVVCTYQTDFIESYKHYIDVADHVLMPSRSIADYYNLHTDKNLYLGIPKYDIEIDKSSVLNKYSLPKDGKFATLISPKGRDQAHVDFPNLMACLDMMGYTVLFKSRGKDPVSSTWKQALKSNGHYCFLDDSWYPHTTQELLSISDIAINFGSTTVEECVMHNVPLINFDIKPEFRNGSKRPYRVTHDYLYRYGYCVDMNKKFTHAEFAAAITYLNLTDLDPEFRKARKDYLFDSKDTCKNLLDVLV